MSEPTRREIEELVLRQRVVAIVWASHLSSSKLVIDGIELEGGIQLTFEPALPCTTAKTVRMVVSESLDVGEHSYPVELDQDMPDGEYMVKGYQVLPATPEGGPEEEGEMPIFPGTRWEAWEP